MIFQLKAMHQSNQEPPCGKDATPDLLFPVFLRQTLAQEIDPDQSVCDGIWHKVVIQQRQDKGGCNANIADDRKCFLDKCIFTLHHNITSQKPDTKVSAPKSRMSANSTMPAYERQKTAVI